MLDTENDVCPLVSAQPLRLKQRLQNILTWELSLF